MAVGGWKYYGYNTSVHTGSIADVRAEMAEWKTALVTMLALGGTGWSLHADIAYYGQSISWFALEHTGGARVVFIRVGDATWSSTAIHANNDAENTTRIEQSNENLIFAAYVQPHLSATAFVGNPDSAGFLPGTSLKFFSMRGTTEVYNPDPGPNGYHVMVRGGDMIIAMSYGVTSNPAIDTVAIMGECLDKLVHAEHPTEPDDHANSKYAHMQWDDCNYAGSMRCQFFDAEGNLRLASGGTYLSGILTDNICDRAPFPWQVPLLYVSSSNLLPVSAGGWGVVTGNGLKGYMNPEWMRFTNFPDGPANNKQRMDGGDFIYLRAGIAVGWDPSNGSML